MMQDSNNRGHEWEDLLSPADFSGGGAAYYSIASLIVSQEYELRRLGDFRQASNIRLAWALHADDVSEREIAAACDTTRHQIRNYISVLQAMILQHLDTVDAT
jgi:hypothetical protein